MKSSMSRSVGALILNIRFDACPWMVPVIRRSQVQVGDVRVDLRRRNITVPEQRLDRTRISTVLQQMRGEAVPQRVWRNIFNAYFFRVSLDHGPRNLSCERPAPIQKNKRGTSLAVTSLHRRILLQPVNRALPERHAPFLVSFAVTHNETRHQIHVRLFQSDEL